MCADRKGCDYPRTYQIVSPEDTPLGKRKLTGVNKGYLVQYGGKQGRQPGSKGGRGGGGQKVGGMFEKLQSD